MLYGKVEVGAIAELCEQIGVMPHEVAVSPERILRRSFELQSISIISFERFFFPHRLEYVDKVCYLFLAKPELARGYIDEVEGKRH
jgi:hypothetical protein